METVGSKFYFNKSIIGYWILCIQLTLFASLSYAQTVSTGLPQSLRSELNPAAKTMIMCTREIQLKPGVDPAAFEKWIMEYWNPEWKDCIPGYESYVDKNQEEPRYIYCLKFNVNNNGIPVNALEYIDWQRELIYYKPTKHLYEELFEYIEADPFFNNKYCYEQ